MATVTSHRALHSTEVEEEDLLNDRLENEEEKSEEEEDEEEGNKKESLASKLRRPFSPCDAGDRKNQNDKSNCVSEKMAKTIKKKAEIRAQRYEDITNPVRLKAYRAHRLRIKTVRPYVDSSNPMDGKIPYINPNQGQRLINLARIERENALMLRHLAEIINGQGTFDTRRPKTDKCINHRSISRQHRLLKITFENLSLLKRIQSMKPFYSRQGQLRDYSRHEQIMANMSIYPLFWQLDKECKYGPYEEKARANSQNNPRPRCFLALGSSEKFFGKVVFQLYAKECPMTAENFRGLCSGEYGLSYKCSTIHRVVKDILWQGGDVTGQGGSGSKSVFGDLFPDENFTFKHDKPGVLSMASSGPNSNGSQFIITAKKLPVLDGTNVVFGKVVSGLGILKKIFKEINSSGRPKKKIFVVDCGELDPSEEICEDGEEDCEEEDEDETEEGTDEDDGNSTDRATASTMSSTGAKGNDTDDDTDNAQTLEELESSTA